MPRIPNNRDLFAERGDPWEVSERPRAPHLSPNGQLRMSPDAHRRALLEQARLNRVEMGLTRPLTRSVKAVPLGELSQTDLDSFRAEKALPLSERIKKERNLVLPHTTPRIPSSVSPGRAAMISHRAKLRSRAVIKVK